MKNACWGWIIVCVLLFWAWPASAFEPSTPDEVDVFPQGADVSWMLPAQSSMEIILPSSFSKDRIRYQVRDGASVDSMSAEYRLAKGWTPAGLRTLMDEKEWLENQLRVNAAELAGVQQTLEYLDDASIFGAQEDPTALLRELQALRFEMETEKQRLEKEGRQHRQSLQELQTRMRQWYGGDLEQKLVVNLTTNGTGEVFLTAFSSHAQWQPFYEAALDSENSTVTLQSYVAVRQRTGLAWDGTIRSHTAAPTDAVGMPAVSPLVARAAEPAPPMPTRTETRAPAAFMMDEEMKEAVPEMVQVDSAAGVIFSGAGRVESDGNQERLTVALDSLAVDIQSTLLPFQSEQAWLLTETKEPMRALLQGEAELIVDGALSGRSQLRHTGGGETLELAFGRSPLVTAERTPVVYTETRTWRGREVLRDGYHLDVRNGTSRELDVKVVDRVPVSGHDRISVKTDIDPAPDEDEEGILTWYLTLAPGESRQFKVEYEVEYPGDTDLSIR